MTTVRFSEPLVPEEERERLRDRKRHAADLWRLAAAAALAVVGAVLAAWQLTAERGSALVLVVGIALAMPLVSRLWHARLYSANDNDNREEGRDASL